MSDMTHLRVQHDMLAYAMNALSTCAICLDAYDNNSVQHFLFVRNVDSNHNQGCSTYKHMSCHTHERVTSRT